MFYVPLQLLLIGPVIYFYTQTLLNKSFKLSKKTFGTFACPGLFSGIPFTYVFVTDQLILHDTLYADGDGS